MSELNLDESALEAAMVADSKCQQESCNVQECNGFFCHRALAAYIARTPSRNDVLEEAAKVADQEMLRAKAEVETYETGCAYRTAALAEMGLAARFAQSIRALKDRDR